MPYQNEYADKSSHTDIVNNPDVKNFLENCSFMKEPSQDDIDEITNKFIEVITTEVNSPQNIISIDGSYYEASVRKEIPCTRVGYVKVGNLLIKRNDFYSLKGNTNFVNPFKVAALKENNSSVTFAFPSSNMKYKDEENVRDSFRRALDETLCEIRTNPKDPKTSLRSTLFLLSSYRGDGNTRNKMILFKCPTCNAEKIEVMDVEGTQRCPHCNNKIYPSDCLRIWEEVSDSVSNQSALNRFMNVIEHIFPIHYMRVVKDANPQSYIDILNNVCFFIDGPLAIFGNAAWVHNSIKKFLSELNSEMRDHSKRDIMILGLQKGGYVYDYFQLINKHIKNNTIYCLEDDFRYKYILFDSKSVGKSFGDETYYGQDFLYKSNSGKIFVFDIPYDYIDEKNRFDINNYENLNVYLNIIQDFECDLYENAVIPIALAHKYTAISLEPGGKVLDLLSKTITN